MELTTEAGIRKKSFELSFHDGKIWCEHLDSMGTCEQAVLDKLTADAVLFSRPSVSSFMIINLDDTVITDAIFQRLTDTLASVQKFRKIALVGIPREWQKRFRSMLTGHGAVITFLNDYEQAKQWIFRH